MQSHSYVQRISSVHTLAWNTVSVHFAHRGVQVLPLHCVGQTLSITQELIHHEGILGEDMSLLQDGEQDVAKMIIKWI